MPDGCVAAMNNSSHLGEETPVHSPVSNIVPMHSQYQQPVLHSDSQQLPSVINPGFGVQQQPLHDRSMLPSQGGGFQMQSHGQQHIHEQGQFAVGSLGPMCGSDFQQLPSGSVINPGFDQQQQPLHDRSILPSQSVGFQMHSHDQQHIHEQGQFAVGPFGPMCGSDFQQLLSDSVIDQQPLQDSTLMPGQGVSFQIQSHSQQHINAQGQFAVGQLGPVCDNNFQQLASDSVINPGFDQQQQPLHDRSILPSQGVGFQMHSHDQQHIHEQGQFAVGSLGPMCGSDFQQLPSGSVINPGFDQQQQPLHDRSMSSQGVGFQMHSHDQQHIHEQGQFAVGSLGPMCGSDFQQLPSGSVINPGFDQQQQPLHDRSMSSQGVGFQMHSHDQQHINAQGQFAVGLLGPVCDNHFQQLASDSVINPGFDQQQQPLHDRSMSSQGVGFQMHSHDQQHINAQGQFAVGLLGPVCDNNFQQLASDSVINPGFDQQQQPLHDRSILPSQSVGFQMHSHDQQHIHEQGQFAVGSFGPQCVVVISSNCQVAV